MRRLRNLLIAPGIILRSDALKAEKKREASRRRYIGAREAHWSLLREFGPIQILEEDFASPPEGVWPCPPKELLCRPHRVLHRAPDVSSCPPYDDELPF